MSLLNLILSTKGKIFRVTYNKRTTGEVRILVGRLGVQKGVKGVGSSYDPKQYNLLTVYDLQKQAFRLINLDGIKEVKFQGKIFKSEICKYEEISQT